MNKKMKEAIKDAIDAVIDQFADINGVAPPWDEYIHHELAAQMATAAEAVFDSTQAAQKFANLEPRAR